MLLWGEGVSLFRNLLFSCLYPVHLHSWKRYDSVYSSKVLSIPSSRFFQMHGFHLAWVGMESTLAIKESDLPSADCWEEQRSKGIRIQGMVN